jgi:hypothetical protein
VALTFSWGFGVVLFFWFIGYGVALAVGMVRKL